MKDITAYLKKTRTKLLSAYPSLSSNQASTIAVRYLNSVRDEVIAKFPFMPQSIGADYCVSLQAINTKSRSTINGQQVYMNDWFQNNAPLYKIINLGDNIKKRYTEITLMYDLEILNTMIKIDEPPENDKQFKERFHSIYSKDDLELLESSKDVVEMVPVDLHSLHCYMKFLGKRISEIQSNTKGADKLKARFRKAYKIFESARLFDGVLPHIPSESAFGRKYYKSINLQSVHKSVRHAALGKCIQYDIENSVFAWRYSVADAIAKKYDKKYTFPYTMEYLDRKKQMRDELSKKYQISIQKVKEAFTAISFGATGTQSYASWAGEDGKKLTPSLNEILTFGETRKAFLADEFVKDFIKEQKDISAIIFTYYQNDPTFEAPQEIKKSNGTLNRAKTLAYLYQTHERKLLDTIVSCFEPDNVLLTVHDGIYIKKDDTQGVVDARHMLKQINRELDIDRTQILASKDNAKEDRIDALMLEHHNRMAHEAQKASNYKPKHSNIAVHKKTDLDSFLTNDTDDENYELIKALNNSNPTGKVATDEMLKIRGEIK